MKKIHQLFILFFLVALLIIPFGNNALAIEGSFPAINGINLADAANQNFAGFVAYIFYFCIAIAGILGVIILSIAGFEYVISAGNPAKIGDAQDRVRSALLGIGLLFLSFIIISTINPALTSLGGIARNFDPGLPLAPLIVATPPITLGQIPTSPQPTHFAGISYAIAAEVGADGEYDVDYNCTNFAEDDACIYVDETNDGIDNGKEYTPADPEIPDMDAYNITDPDGGLFYNHSKDTITVQVYYEDDYEENSQTETIELDPEATISLAGVESLTWRVREPGLYFYSKAGCTGNSMYEGITNTGDLPREFFDTKSVKIINDAENNIYFGFILNAAPNFQGQCTTPSINKTADSICLSVPNNFIPQYVSVFNWNPQYNDQKNYQNGVSIYGMPVRASGPVSGSSTTQQNYYNIRPDKLINQYYYAPNGPNGEGYYRQNYYNISANEIISQIDANINQDNGGYYRCANDPGFLLVNGASACAALPASPSPSPDQCTIDQPNPADIGTSCPTSNGPACIQSIESRDRFLTVLFTVNENGSNQTCSIFSGSISNLPEVESVQNGKRLIELDIVPIQ